MAAIGVRDATVSGGSRPVPRTDQLHFAIFSPFPSIRSLIMPVTSDAIVLPIAGRSACRGRYKRGTTKSMSERVLNAPSGGDRRGSTDRVSADGRHCCPGHRRPVAIPKSLPATTIIPGLQPSAAAGLQNSRIARPVCG